MRTPHATSSEVRQLDHFTIHDAGLPGLCLMELAGAGAVQVLERHAPVARSDLVVMVAGKGNNAGDAYVVGRHLAAQGQKVRVLALEDPGNLPPGDARTNADLLPAWGVRVEVVAPDELGPVCAGAEVIVDGLLGTGLRGAVRPPFDDAIRTLNAASAPILALDLPSGLCGDSGDICGVAIEARWTATFGAVKRGLVRGEGPRLAGAVELVPLPFPPAAWQQLITPPDGD